MEEETIFSRLKKEYESGKEYLKTTKISIENYIINPLSTSIKSFSMKMIKIPAMISNKFSTVFSNINSQLNNILGSELTELFGMASNLFKSTFSVLSSVTKSVFSFGKSLFSKNSEKEQTGILKNIFSIFKKREKQEKMQYKDKGKGSILETLLYGAGITLGVIIGGFVSTIGGIIKSALIPFQLIGKGISILTQKVTFINKWISSSKIFQKIINIVSKVKSLILSPFDKLFSIFGKFSNVMSKIPIISKFFAGFSKGLSIMLKGIPIIGWGITIINGIIDFFKGFVSTQGSFLDKLKGGLFATIKGIFDPFISFFDWLGNKVLGFFGINMEGTISQFFIAKITWLKDAFLSSLEFIKNSFSSILNYILMPFKWINNTIQNFIGLLKTGIDNISNINFMESIVNVLLKLKEAIKEWVLENIPGAKQLAKGIGSVKSWISGFFSDKESDEFDKMKSSSSGINTIKGVERDISTEKNKKEQKQQEKIDKLISQTEKNINNQNNNATIIQQISSSNQKSQLNESPDEVENFGIIFMNNSTLGGAL